MRKLQIAATATMLSLSAIALAETKEFNGSQGSSWHLPGNWGPNTGVPDIDDDVIIPSTLHCLISSQNAVAKSVSITGGGELQVSNGHTLQIRTPNASDAPMLIVIGELTIDDDGVLLLEDDGSGDDIARIIGDGTVWGGYDTSFATGSGSNAIDRIYVGEDITVLGWWSVPLDMENDGLVWAWVTDMVFSNDSSPLGIGGAGTFYVSGGGSITFDCADFEGGTVEFTGTLWATSGDMYLDSCGAIQKPQLGAATVIADGGAIWCDNGFASDGGTITVSAGDIYAYGDVNIDDTELTVAGDGALSISQANMHIDYGSTVTIEDEGYLGMSGLLYVANTGDDVSIAISDDGDLFCYHFEMTDTDLLIESGTFQVNGLPEFEDAPSDFIGGSIIITGGAFKIGWGFQSYSGVDLYILGGTLEVLADEDEERAIAFVHDAGTFLFTAGSIKVAQGEKFLAD
jgi:hypothetical protein